MFLQVNDEKKVKVLVIFTFLVIVGAVIVFFKQFGFDLDTPIENWVNTATYFNNLLTPLLLFVTVLLLFWTWRDTKKGLDKQSNDNKYSATLLSFESLSKEFKLRLYSGKFTELSQNKIKQEIAGIVEDMMGKISKTENKTDSQSPSAPKLKDRIIEINKHCPTLTSTVDVIYKFHDSLNEEYQESYRRVVYGVFGFELCVFIMLNLMLTHAEIEDKYKEHYLKVFDFFRDISCCIYSHQDVKENYFNEEFLEKCLE